MVSSATSPEAERRTIPKAYLAHSSDDKDFVELVASRLGRPLVIYDRWSFEPGKDFRDLIRTGLSESSVLVLFASKSSLKSTWVSFEIDEAEWLRIQGKLAGAMVILIDKDVSSAQLPAWMQRCLVIGSGSPLHAARIIRTRLLSYGGLEPQMPFIGRENELAEFANYLIGSPEEPAPRVLVVGGLEGVGRRTFMRRALRDYVSLEVGPTVHLGETDGLDMLYWFLLEETAESGSGGEVARHLQAFQELDSQEQAREIARVLTIIARNNEAALIVGRGALLDDQGRYSKEMVQVFEALRTEDEHQQTYVAICHSPRTPAQIDTVSKPLGLAFYRLRPLSPVATGQLVTLGLRRANVDASNEECERLAAYMNGYPPAVEFAVQYATTYGLDVLIEDTEILGDFQARIFAPILQKLPLEEREWKILRLLAGINVLSLKVLAELLRATPQEVAQTLHYLVDLNLVIPVTGGHAISGPVRAAVSRLMGSLTKAEYADIAQILIETFWADPKLVTDLRVIDATIQALLQSDGDTEQERFRRFVVPSHLFRAAKEAYDSYPRKLERAIDFARRTLRADPSRHGARIILFKALTRKDQWEQASTELSKLEKATGRTQFYLKGFFEWKRGDLKKAVSAFRSALRTGDRSISVFRDLAGCLLYLGEVEEAGRIISEALERQERNRYLVDLAAKIAIASRDWDAAKTHIGHLEHIDTKERYHHRRANLYAARKQWSDALMSAQIACESDSPAFEALTQRVDILIELSEFEDAEKAIDAVKPFSLASRDVITGLRCKLLLRSETWSEAELVWQKLVRKDLPVQTALRAEIFRKKVADPMISPVDRQAAISELNQMGEQIEISSAALSEDHEGDDG